MAETHYHAPADDEREVVYRDKRDADDCWRDTKARSERSDTDFKPRDLRGKKVRACDEPGCIEVRP